MKRTILIIMGILATFGIAYAIAKPKKADETAKDKTASKTLTPPKPILKDRSIPITLAEENEEREKLGLPPKTDRGPSHS